MTAEQIVGVLLLIACLAAAIWRIGRTWDRAYQLGWQHGRAQLAREESDALFARIQARRRAVEAQLVERDAGAVN